MSHEYAHQNYWPLAALFISWYIRFILSTGYRKLKREGGRERKPTPCMHSFFNFYNIDMCTWEDDYTYLRLTKKSIANLWWSYTTALSSSSSEPGNISREAFLNENEFSSWSLSCDSAECLRVSAFPDTCTSEYRYECPWKAERQELRDEVLLIRGELELAKSSSRTTLSGFSSAFKMYRASGRLEGFGFKHAFATIETAHTSSRWSSSTISKGSTIFEMLSLSCVSI
jgi:hypothetical protein